MDKKKFTQFVTDKDKGKAPVEKIADYKGPFKDAPPEGGQPYVATGEGGKVKKGEVGQDWTDKGDKALVYKPKIDQDEKGTTGKAKCVITAENNKPMNAAEFAKFLADNGNDSGTIHESIQNACQTLVKHPGNVADLVRELKRSGLLKQTVVEALSHPESYEAVKSLLEDEKKGESVFRKIAGVLDEMVGPPMHHGMPGHMRPPLRNMVDGGRMGDPRGGGPHMRQLPMGMDSARPGMDHPHHNVDGDEFGLDDEDMDVDPNGMPLNQNPVIDQNRDPLKMGVGRPHHRPEGPKPSFMARMMARS